MEQRTFPTPSGDMDVLRKLQGVRRTAKEKKQERFTALLHHVTVDLLRESFHGLKKQAAPGVDGVTWKEYEHGLEDRLTDLHGRVHRGAYRAQPSRRIYIPKADGRKRPLGIAALEDTIVQQAIVTVLNEIYEADFLGFSYGFRPGRSPHRALDALSVGIVRRRVSWILDADIRGFFDNLSHEWLLTFVHHRIADPRMLRLIRKWLKAGVSEDGEWSETTIGTPQGAVISPLLANIYLHYVFDLWVEAWREKIATGDLIVVRYADDLVVGFQHKADAERFLSEFKERLAKFGLELQPIRVGLGSIGFHGDLVLRCGAGLGSATRVPGDLQHGSRRPVHQRAFYGPIADSGNRHQHGWAGPGDRQHLHRTFVANGEIRRGLSEGLSGRAGSVVQPQSLFCFLQSRTSASNLGLSNTSSGLLSTAEGNPMSPKSRHAEGRGRSRSASINDPGANNFGAEPRFQQRKKKDQKERKVRKGRPVETAAAMEIKKGGLRQLLLDDFHRCLKKPAQERLRLFHSYAQSRRRLIYKPIFERQRSTLSMLFFGPKNGEHLQARHRQFHRSEAPVSAFCPLLGLPSWLAGVASYVEAPATELANLIPGAVLDLRANLPRSVAHRSIPLLFAFHGSRLHRSWHFSGWCCRSEANWNQSRPVYCG